MNRSVDLNADLGESWGAYTMGRDAEMLDIVTSANVACGFHGGDWNVMRETVRLAKQRGVGIGAHPSFDDLRGFGRRRISGDTFQEIENLIAYQIGALQAMAAMEGATVTHVKSHGALGNMVTEDEDLARAVARAAKAVDPSLTLVAMPGTANHRAGEAVGLPVALEVYADRAYEADGTLTPRRLEGSMIHDADMASERVLRMINAGEIEARTGEIVSVSPETVCVHGDNPKAVAMAKAIRDRLEQDGVALKPF